MCPPRYQGLLSPAQPRASALYTASGPGSGRPYHGSQAYGGPTVAAFLASRRPHYERELRLYPQITHNFFFEGVAQPVYTDRRPYTIERGGGGGGPSDAANPLMVQSKGADYSLQGTIRRLQAQLATTESARALSAECAQVAQFSRPGLFTTVTHLDNPKQPSRETPAPYAPLPYETQRELAQLAVQKLVAVPDPDPASMQTAKPLADSLERQIAALERELLAA